MTISQNKTLRNIRTSVVIGILLACATVSTAQVIYPPWKQLGTTRSTVMRCAYFFDTLNGVVAGVGTSPAIWVYKNGIWTTPTSTPISTPDYFTSINELKPGVLYATSGATDVWVSNDSGMTWQNTTTAGGFALDAYFTKDDSLHASYQGTFARLDSNICIVTNNNGSKPSYSTDGGKTWIASTTNYNIGGLGAYADTCRKMFYAASKDSTAFYSIDSGRTWHPCGPKLSEDILSGADGAVYHQDTMGVWCSVDAGTSWQLLNGPKATTGDYGICGFGPHGKWIVAITGGEVWLYSHVDALQPTDPITRGDTIENCPITRIPVTVRPFTRPFQVTMQLSQSGPQTLSPRDTTFTLQPGAPITVWYTVSPTIAGTPTFADIDTKVTDGCREFDWIDTFTIVTVPLPISTPNVRMQNCNISEIPLAIYSPARALRMFVSISADSGWSVSPTTASVNLAAGLRDTIWLTPINPSLPIGTLVHVRAWDTVACTIYSWDTSFTVSIVPVPVSWTWVDSVKSNACDSVKVPIAFNLASCDSLALDSLTFTPSDGLLYFDNNPNLARGRIDTLWLTYAPHGRNDTTKYGVNIFSHFVPEGIHLDTTLPLKAGSFGSPHPRASVASTLAITSCDPVVVPVYIKAAGCEDIRIDSIAVDAAGVIVSGGLTGPDTLLAGATDTVRYTIESLYPTVQARPLNFHCYLYRMGDLVTLDTEVTVALSVSGASTEPLISLAPKLDLSNCTASIVPVILHAPMCDSVVISSCGVTVPNGINESTNLTFPLMLQTDEFDTVLISFPPQGLNQTATVSVQIRGGYGGTITSFDTTAESQVTFVCADDVTPAGVEGSPLVLTGLQSTAAQLQFGVTKNDGNISECQAEIVSILGDIVAQKTFPLLSSQNDLSWSLNDLPSGTYYLRIVSGVNRISGRFVNIK